MNYFYEIIGFVAASLTTGAFLPQLIKIIVTKRIEGLSLLMLILQCLGSLLWLLYGFLIKSLPVIIENAISSVIIFIIILTFVRLRFFKSN